MTAMDASSAQVDFDSLTERYKGKKVWVIDRDKIRTRVAQVVDAALAQSHQSMDDTMQTRARVATAIHGLFADNRNIATERSMASVQAERAAEARQQRMAGPASSPLEDQVERLAKLIDKAEGVLTAISAAARSGGFGGGGGPRRSAGIPASLAGQQNEVLLEIFKANLELHRSMSRQGYYASGEGESFIEPAGLSAGEPQTQSTATTDKP